MIRKLALTAALATLPLSAMAQDYSEGSTAKKWNLYAEQKAFFKAKVVDPLCELTGECAEDCGGGARQLALLRADDNAMILPLKNSQPAFTGATLELLPFCDQQVEVDGLMLDDEDLNAKNLYMVQKIRAVGDEKWTKANSWTKKWAKAHPEAKGKSSWFRRDPRINEEIATEGYLGLGLETDKEFIAEWF